MGEWKDILVAPRWAGLSSFIKDECFKRGLDLKIDVDRGLVREKMRIVISGEDAAVEALRKHFYAAVASYNK